VAWHTVEPASRIRVGQVLPFTIAGRRLAVGRTARGYFAADDRCPHAQGSLGEGMIEKECVVCPVHGFAWNVRTGEGLDFPAPLRVHPVALEGDVLRIWLEETKS
jgi:nitrite reductase/ring-hydroxylating ferredoxin subunit